MLAEMLRKTGCVLFQDTTTALAGMVIQKPVRYLLRATL
jgi:hypothetical protein